MKFVSILIYSHDLNNQFITSNKVQVISRQDINYYLYHSIFNTQTYTFCDTLQYVKYD
jgi:hypothetical protein